MAVDFCAPCQLAIQSVQHRGTMQRARPRNRPPAGVRNSSPMGSRSLSVSSDSDAVDEPKVLEEARRGSAANGSSRNFKRGSKGRVGLRRRRSKGSSGSGQSVSNYNGLDSLRHALGAGSREQGSGGAAKESGSLDYLPARVSAGRPIGVSFIEQLRASSSNVTRLLSHHTAEHPTSGTTTDADEPVEPHIGISDSPQNRARAVASANRNLAAMAAERKRLQEMQSPVLDAMEVEIRGLHRQLDDVKESFHKRCMSIFDSFVESKWTIGTSGEPSET